MNKIVIMMLAILGGLSAAAPMEESKDKEADSSVLFKAPHNSPESLIEHDAFFFAPPAGSSAGISLSRLRIIPIPAPQATMSAEELEAEDRALEELRNATRRIPLRRAYTLL